MGNKKQVKAIRERYGKNWFSEQGAKPHLRGNAFENPDVREKAMETRRRNKAAREERKANEVPANDNV